MSIVNALSVSINEKLRAGGVLDVDTLDVIDEILECSLDEILNFEVRNRDQRMAVTKSIVMLEFIREQLKTIVN